MFLTTGWFISWRRMPCFVFVAGFSPANRLKAMRTTGMKSELVTLKRIWRKLAVMKIPYFIAPVLLTGNHSNTDYLLGRQSMHIQEQLDRERKHCKFLIAFFLPHSFWPFKGFLFEAIVSKVTKIWWQRLGIVVITWNCLNWLQGTTTLWHPIWPARNLGASILPRRFRMRSSIP